MQLPGCLSTPVDGDSPDAMRKLSTYLSFVRIGHTVFALPFALTGALLAWREVGFSATQAGWIILCMVAARSAAMGFNRTVDARFDALNPRTAARELPRGRMSTREASLFVAIASGIFVFAAFRLSSLCGALSPVALAIVFWYSLAKRYTAYTQMFLGVAMAIAPKGGWLAAGGGASWQPWLLGLAIGLWVGGFDVLYACQDVEFDRAHGLRSIPARFGIRRAILMSRVMHVVAVVGMAALWQVAALPATYLAGVAGVAVLLVFEQSLVSDSDLSQVKRAFDLNGWVGIVYFVSTATSLYFA
jgi:4-hydroxybenzoate polyprenyltransferase